MTMTIAEMEALDKALGVVEVCAVCGVEHFAKSDVCGDCHWIQKMADIMDADIIVEPISYESMVG